MEQKIQLVPDIISIIPGRITVGLIELGNLQVNSIAITNRLQSTRSRLPRIIIDNCRAGLFGGTASAADISIDPRHLDTSFTISLDGLDMAGIITFLQVKNLKVTGRLAGALPVRIKSRRIWVDRGALHGLPPGGIIRYHVDRKNGVAGSPYAETVLKALEEYHYKKLKATASYVPDGQLSVNLHIEGTSPKLDSSRPVHFNIKTEQNLLSLLRSLEYSKSLINALDKKIEHRYDASTTSKKRLQPEVKP